MKINYTYFKILILTAVMTLIFFKSGAVEIRGSNMSTEHVFGFISLSENQTKKLIKSEKAGDNIDKIDEKENKEKEPEALENNIFYPDEWIKSWFIRLDQNEDNLVSKEEFIKNMEPFSIENKHLTVFESKQVNADGVLNLIEFQKFIDSTKFLSKDEMFQKEATLTEDADDVDTIKLMAAVLAISLLIAVFKFV